MENQALKQTLLSIFDKLLSRYGPQHWWPAREPFEVIVGAILTQSAAWTNVEKAIDNLRAEKALSPKALREMSHFRLARLVHSSGYYNAKANKLKALAQWLGDNYDDSLEELFDLDIDTLRSRLLSVHGIGEETADSIILYAACKPVFVIDAYTRRIFNRLGLTGKNDVYAAHQAFFMSNLPPYASLFNEYHALLVCLAKNACRKQPLCRRCPLNESCRYYRDLQS